MTQTMTIVFLLLAASLEACGDALIRVGLRTTLPRQRLLLFGVAAMILFAYGWTVNAPAWDFGKLLGLYVVFFFVIAQLLSWLVFKHVPSTALWVGGAFIVTGGVIVAVSKA